MKNPPLMTEKAAASRLALHPDTLKARRLRGQALPHIDIGCGSKPVVRYALEDVEAYILQRRCVNTRPTAENGVARKRDRRA